MKQKELLLWVVAIAALTLSLIAVIGPKGLKSDAAMSTSQIDSVQNAGPVTAFGFPATLTECIQIAERAYNACSVTTDRCFSIYLQAEKNCKNIFAPSN
jgi:hypothetical protein